MAIRFAAAKGNTPDFTPSSLSSPRVGSSAGAAAGAVSTSNIFGALRNKAPKYDQIVNTAADVATATDIAAKEAEAQLSAAYISGLGTAARGKMEADMYKEMASAAQSGGQMSLFGGIAGGAISLLTGGLA